MPFSGDVRLKHPQYRLEADTLQYNTGTEVAWFHGPTTIYNENSTVYCEDGYYETISGIAVFNEHVQMDNPPQELQADSIFYNGKQGWEKPLAISSSAIPASTFCSTAKWHCMMRSTA